MKPCFCFRKDLFACKKCGFVTTSLVLERQHFKDVHGPKNKCPRCASFYFPDSHWRLYRQHWRQHHAEMPIEEPVSLVKVDKAQDFSDRIEPPEDVFSANPLNLDMGPAPSIEPVVIKPEMSDWKREPDEGFLELLDDQQDIDQQENEQHESVIQAGLTGGSPLEWQLHPIDVSPPLPMICKTYQRNRR